MKRFIYNWGPVLLYAGLIFLISHRQAVTPPISDKLWHVLEYAVMGFFTARAVLLTWDLPKWWGVVLSLCITAGFGALDEFHQLYVPGREGTLGDFLADVGGGLLGTLGFFYLGVALYKSRKLYPRAHDKCC